MVRLNRGVRPVHPSLRIGSEENEQTNRISSILHDHQTRAHGIAQRLAHLHRTRTQPSSTGLAVAAEMIDVIFSIAISAEGSGRIEHALAD